jgi:beta-glucosidase
MLIETGISSIAEDIINHKQPNFNVIIPAPERLEMALNQFNHKLLAVAAAAKIFHTYHIPQGEVGVAFPLVPTIAVNPESSGAAAFIDGIANRWFLDAIYKGSYPQDILDYAGKHQFNLKIQKGDAKEIQSSHMTYLGINYYAPMYVQNDEKSDIYGLTVPKLPNTDYAFNGPNMPDQFERLLLRIKDEYGNPRILITENGAGFPGEDELKNGKVNDIRRTNYIKTHIAAMQSAMSKGVKISGYHVWSSHDNLEWISGYGSRFGMIYVDFDTQQRVLKNSALAYSEFVKKQLANQNNPSK